jgi:hypothetical protein
VRTNDAVRAAFAETSGAAGAFALPLQLDPNITISNAGLPPRFRAYDTARPTWIANVAIINALRQIPSFTGPITSLVTDNQPGDNPPQVRGNRHLRGVGDGRVQRRLGHKNLLIRDFSQFVIVERMPSVRLYDALVLAQASALPSGQRDGTATPVSAVT